jgi:1,2-diacylglycerol 3-beta-galactosyltransferase
MAPEKVRVTGLPIDPRFEELGGANKGELRRSWGLSGDRPLALVMGGGEGAGKLYDLVSALDRARVPAALAVVAGRNRALRRRLEEKDWEIEVRVLGFVQEMPELMGASDIILTKAGPATLWEAMTAGLPIIMTGYVPGQEEGNADFVQGAGAGCLVRDPGKVAESLLAWFRPEDDTLARMAHNSRALARPQAALEIADLLADLVG